MRQLGELQKRVDQLQAEAEVYVINSDTPANSRRLKQITRISVPVLLDEDLSVVQQYDLLPKPGQPMGGMRGVAQMGFAVVDSAGVIRLQRVDLEFGSHAPQILDILRILGSSP